MQAKARIAIVASELKHPRSLRLFFPISETCEVTVMTFNSEQVISGHDSGLKLLLYEPSLDMAGYMRGLEEELAKYDQIIAIDSTRLASFQALRAARKNNLPFYVVSENASFEFVKEFPNIRAIHHDIIARANGFFALSPAAVTALKAEGVDKEKIWLQTPWVDCSRFAFNPQLRKKFRDYVGIGSADIVVLVQEDLEKTMQQERILQYLVEARRSGSLDFSNLKVLFCGQGEHARDLKYRAVDLDVARNVIFLHQDSTPFLVDLLSASDYIYQSPAVSQSVPHRELEGVVNGMLAIASPESYLAQIIGKENLFTDPWSELIRPANLELRRKRQGQVAAKLERLENVIIGKLTHFNASPRDEMADISRAIKAGKFADALLLIEEHLSFGTSRGTAKMLCVRGEIFLAQGKMEAAMDSFSEALRLDDRLLDAYRGLGQVSFRSHSHDEALTFFKRALAIDACDSRTILGIGLVYRRLGVLEDALYWLEQAVAQDPSASAAVAALTQTCNQCSNVQIAIDTLTRLTDSVGDITALVMTLGHLYIKQGQVETGTELVKKALAS